MPLPVLTTVVIPALPFFYALLTSIICIVLSIIHLFARGPKTSRDRDLHDRVIIVTGAFHTTFTLSLLEELARRGGHIIALVHPAIIHSSESNNTEVGGVEEVVDAMREATGNKNIYLESVDLESPESIRYFCSRFLKTEKRLDAIVFTHEYKTIGALRWFSSSKSVGDEVKMREPASLATFYLTTLLLPSLLVAPTQRDIRIVNVVNPFYAAALPSNSFPDVPKSASTLLLEATRSLRSIIFTQHVQKVLDSLPVSQVPDPNDLSVITDQKQPASGATTQASNISAVVVNPGITRADTVYHLLCVKSSWLGFLLYMISFPILLLLTKSSHAALQTVLHVLFVPTKAKLHVSSSDKADASPTNMSGCLLPGALYADCKVIPVRLQRKLQMTSEENMAASTSNEDGDDAVGRAVWEMMERGIKSWDDEEKSSQKERNGSSPSGK